MLYGYPCLALFENGRIDRFWAIRDDGLTAGILDDGRNGLKGGAGCVGFVARRFRGNKRLCLMGQLWVRRVWIALFGSCIHASLALRRSLIVNGRSSWRARAFNSSRLCSGSARKLSSSEACAIIPVLTTSDHAGLSSARRRDMYWLLFFNTRASSCFCSSGYCLSTL